MQPMLNIALRAARLAGEQINRAAERLDLIKAEQSNVVDFLHHTASQAEQTIAYTIQKAYPTHSLEGQYSGAYAPVREEAEHVHWQITPIDSATNFCNGLPTFALCLSATLKGKTEHALILNPISGEEFTASRGQGASINGKRMRVSTRRTLEGAIIGTSFLNSEREKAQFPRYRGLIDSLHQANGILHNNGSAALNMAYTASGRMDGVLQIGLDPHINVAGALLLQEAGALIGDFNGTHAYKTSGDIVAANPKLFKALIQATHSSSHA